VDNRYDRQAILADPIEDDVYAMRTMMNVAAREGLSHAIQ
jgi:hypothetical protein